MTKLECRSNDRMRELEPRITPMARISREALWSAALPRRFSPRRVKTMFLRFTAFTLPKQRDPESLRGFTLIELLIVISIIAILMVLLAPAFTSLKSAGDVTSAAYTIKGVLDTARTYAKANNTYTWVGFAGLSGNQHTAERDRASRGRNRRFQGRYQYLWSADNALPAASLIPVGKMETLNNIHIGDTGEPQNDGTEFESRASVDSDRRLSSSSTTPYPFTVQQTTFNKWIQFSPRGEALVQTEGTSAS